MVHVIFETVFCTDQNMQNGLCFENRAVKNKLFISAEVTPRTRHETKKI